jgi:signal transduction histidine kinase
MSRPQSIQARYTAIVTTLTVVVLIAVGASLALAIRYRIQGEIFYNAQRVAGQIGAAVRNGNVRHPIPAATDAGLIQLVDTRGRVVDASRQAAGRPPLSRFRPPPGDRLQKRTECSAEYGCVLLMADRVTPAADSPVVYAGVPEPAILASHSLEYIIATVVPVLTALVAWTTWCVVGRTLRPVAAIRARMAEITVSDLSLRVPEPHGADEIALLARTANQTLARLERAVEQQRQFASTTSHELRNPIAGLRARLEEAQCYPDDVDQREVIEGALSITDRLEAIVNDLLVIARLRAADPAPPELIDLGALAREEAAHGQAQGQGAPGQEAHGQEAHGQEAHGQEAQAQSHGVPVAVHAAPDVRVRGSRIQLIRVLGNLVSNARRHAATGVDVFVESIGGEAVVAVVDDGAGVAPADRERVFERFTRLDDGRRRDSGGSGLGLAISRDIARAHHGTLGIEDSQCGARFVLRLPLSDPASRREPGT